MIWKNHSAGMFTDAGGRVRVVGDPRHAGSDTRSAWDSWTVEEHVGDDWVPIRPFHDLHDAMEWARLTYDVVEPAVREVPPIR